MPEEKKTISTFLKAYYDEKKRLIDTIAFVGVISGIFLEITQFQSEALRTVQASLLVFFGLLLSYLLINFWLRLVSFNQPETPRTIALNGMILSSLIGIFIYNLFKFVYVTFTPEIKLLFTYSKFGLLLLAFFNFSDFTGYLTVKFGKQKFWIIINEVFFGVLLYLCIAGLSIIPFYLICSVAMIVISVMFNYGWITSKTFNRLLIMTVLGLGIIFLIIQHFYNHKI